MHARALIALYHNCGGSGITNEAGARRRVHPAWNDSLSPGHSHADFISQPWRAKPDPSAQREVIRHGPEMVDSVS